jgi:hypothetical protein
MGKIAIVVLLIVTIVAGYFIYTKSIRPSIPSVISDTNPTQSPDSVPVIDEAQVEALKKGGLSYSDKKEIFTFLYPLGYTIDEMNGGEIIRIYKKGDTQQGQTEMYDGVIVTFQPQQLTDSLESYVDSQIEMATKDGTGELTSGKKAVVVGGSPGFTYTIRSLGESIHYVLQKDANSQYGVDITYLVADPQKVGFQKEVDNIISSIKFLK